MNDKGILLETGTNEVEVLELLVGGQSYGVNVLKVKQIISYDPKGLTKIYGLHPAVMGMFLFRGRSVPLINLGTYFGQDQTDTQDLVAVICEFNQSSYGFVVDGLTKIYRISWDQIQSPSYLVQNIQAMITGIVPIENREIMIMDLESIVGEVVGRKNSFDDSDESCSDPNLRSSRLIIADDSVLVQQQISKMLVKAGFENICVCANGQEAYDQIFSGSQEALDNPFDVLVTDIEMPALDGLSLCKKVKSQFPGIRVLVLSSLITVQMIAKCEAAGADGYLSKAEPKKLIPLIASLLAKAAA
jgi:two-component system, chemotaxis family, chemotaxis protein CheV